MGYFFTFLYIVTAYITPAYLFGPLADFHLQVIIVSLAVITSLPGMSESEVFASSQSRAVIGMILTVFCSAIAAGWLGGIAEPMYDFMQPSLAFFLVAINCKTKRHLQWIIVAMFFVSMFYTWAGWQDLRNNVSPSLFLYGDGDLRRLRGLGWVADPNDFSQVLVSLMPLLFLWWRPKQTFFNFVFILVPMLLLLVAMYLTHSRGAALALIVVCIFTFRKKIGTVPSLILATLLFGLTLVVGWSGGRDTSMEAGADRLDLWAGGLEMLKTHLLFGVGLGHFPDYMGITAHNSVVVCAAELGMIGLFFWAYLLLSTVRTGMQLGKLTAPAPKQDDTFALPGTEAGAGAGAFAMEAVQPLAATADPFSFKDMNGPPKISPEEINRVSRLLIISMMGFLTAGWFLSRALSAWLFMYCGMMYALSRMALRSEVPVVRDPFKLELRYSALISVCMVGAVYIILHLRSL